MDPLLILLIGIAVVVAAIAWLRLHAFVALIAAAVVVGVLTPREAIEQRALAQGLDAAAAAKSADETLGPRLGKKFGSIATNLGILIAMASIVGICLMESGAAERLVRSILSLFGEKNTPLVFALSGFILCIPIFFDTVFLLLIPLGRAMARKTGKNYVLYVLCMLAGAVMTHSLVPPTPGPLFVAAALGVDIGVMIIGGLVLGVVTTASGVAYAFWANKRWPWEIDVTLDTGSTFTDKPTSGLPSVWVAILPIFLPLILVAGNAMSGSLGNDSMLKAFLAGAGHPNVALSIAAAIALATLAWTRKGEPGAVRAGVQRALVDAGVIILITCAGGVFGGMLQDTNIGARVEGLTHQFQIAVLPLAFAVTALVRGAQGSATVAMITAVGIFGGFASAETLGFHPVYLALAIGCGSKPFAWMNDSGFWVVCKTTGFSEGQMIRTFSAALTVMGFVGLFAVMLFARLFPFA